MTTYHSDSPSQVVASLERLLAEHEYAEEVVVRQQLTTYLFAHGRAVEVQEKAQSFGLDAGLQTYRGMWARNHTLIVQGPLDDAVRFFEWLAARVR